MVLEMKFSVILFILIFPALFTTGTTSALSALSCSTFPGSDDVCLPGGKFDPILNKCNGYNGRECFGCYFGDTCDEMNNKTCVLSLTGRQITLITLVVLCPNNPNNTLIMNNNHNNPLIGGQPVMFQEYWYYLTALITLITLSNNPV